MDQYGRAAVPLLNPRWSSSLRQDVLDCLDAARASDVAYIGGRTGVISTQPGGAVDTFCRAAGWEAMGAGEWRIPEGIFDLRQTLRYLAEKKGRVETDGSVRKEFSVQFSKAIRLLCERGELISDDPDLPNFAQRRFVRRGTEPWPGYAHASPTQHLIMATLDDAKHAGLVIIGHANGVASCGPERQWWQLFQGAGWERIDTLHWRIPDDVYDMRVSLAYLKSTHPRLTTGFAKAVRRLCDSGALIWQAPDLPNLRQIRFVKRSVTQECEEG